MTGEALARTLRGRDGQLGGCGLAFLLIERRGAALGRIKQTMDELEKAWESVRADRRAGNYGLIAANATEAARAIAAFEAVLEALEVGEAPATPADA